jgi:hypothetical protein
MCHNLTGNDLYVYEYRRRLDRRAPDSGDTFEYRGYTFKITIDRDDHMGEPWKEHDGHGTVSDWRRSDKIGADKAPGERVLVSDRHSYRLYDFAAAVQTARKDGWGCKHSYAYNVGRYVFVSGHKTAGELAACAAECDYERMRRWCNDGWYWCTVSVRLIEFDEDDQEVETDETESLSGIESDSGAYLGDVARELAGEIISRLEVDDPDVQRSEN